MRDGEIGWNGMDWIQLAQDSDKWKVLVSAEIDLQFP
jgi:hypothetical protein